jgi:membrane associated rhomboid family serine protease
MYVLYNFGGLIEDTLVYVYGTTTGIIYYIGMYVGGLIFATLPSLRKHSDNPMYRSLGASGAVSTVLFAFVMYYPLEKLSLLFIPIGIPAFIFGALYLAFETYSNKKGRSNIAHDAHIAGAIFGVVYVVAIDFNNLTNFIAQIGL